MEKLKRKRPIVPRAELNRRADEFLRKIQQELMPAQANKVVAINLETGDYVLADDVDAAADAFWARWPDVLMHRCRVDGGPVFRFHGK